MRENRKICSDLFQISSYDAIPMRNPPAKPVANIAFSRANWVTWKNNRNMKMSVQSSAAVTWFNYHDIYSTTMKAAERKSNFKLTTDTP